MGFIYCVTVLESCMYPGVCFFVWNMQRFLQTGRKCICEDTEELMPNASEPVFSPPEAIQVHMCPRPSR